MADKPKMKYRVVTGKNPSTQETILRPVVTERETYYIDQVVEYAINAGYVRGQFHDMRGALNGFIEAIKQLGLAGKAVNLSNWLRVHAEFTGSVGEDRTLTDDNELRVKITALTDLKVSKDAFSWENIDSPENRVKIYDITPVGGTPGTIKKNVVTNVTGKNMFYNSSYGDKVTATYEGLDTPINISPSENDYSHIAFAWPAGLSELEDGTLVTLKFVLHGGVEGSTEQVLTRVVVAKMA